jgi:hypothetical protein
MHEITLYFGGLNTTSVTNQSYQGRWVYKNVRP